MVSLRRYTASDAPQWDRFVEDSKNGTFLFLRGYMDYHSNRFTDHSLMFYDEKQRLIALLPANEKDGILYSHQGLTYGGLVISTEFALMLCNGIHSQSAKGKDKQQVLFHFIRSSSNKYGR